MGVDRGSDAAGVLARRWPLARSPAGSEWPVLEVGDRGTVAGYSGALRPLADHLRPLHSLARQRAVRPHAPVPSDRVGRGRTDRPGTVVRGQYPRARQPLGRWGGQKGGPLEPADHALGLSRGGFSTKIHLVTDSNGIPLAALLSPGQRHEVPVFPALMDSVSVPRAQGRPPSPTTPAGRGQGLRL